MTVEELIEKLNQIQDKTKQVMFIGMYEDGIVYKVKETEKQIMLL